MAGSGELSVDTLLDRVVFGLPVTSHDLWMKCHLHETSRRRNGECGIDVVVASSSWRHQAANGSRATKNMLTAEQAALTLVNLAKEHFPDSALAQACTFTDLQDESTTRDAIDVDTILQTRGLVETTAGAELRGALELHLPKMMVFLQMPHTFAEIAESLQNGNIYRQSAKQKREEPPLPKESLFKALARHISWGMDPRHRLLTFRRLFKTHIHVIGDSYVAKDSKKHPRPLKLPPPKLN